MGIATMVRKLDGFRGDARLYKLDPPIEFERYEANDQDEYSEVKHASEFVIVSALIAPYSGAETYIFPGDASGEIVDWGELSGSFRGALDHEQALNRAGYQIIHP